MSSQSKTNNSTTNTTQQQQEQRQEQEVKAMFHDFLGMNKSSTPTAIKSASILVASPSSTSAVRGGPLSTSSDLASERQVGNHLEGIPFYSRRSDISSSEMSNRLVGSKRCNSDSVFTGTTNDCVPHIGHDSHLMKLLSSGGGGERSRRSNDNEILHGMQSTRPTPASIVLHPSSSNRFDANVSKQDHPVHKGVAAQHGSHAGQFAPFTHQVPATCFRDSSAGPSIISPSAADEGSRTGIKGSGILSSIKANSEKNSSALLPISSKLKSTTPTIEPESSIPPSRQGLASGSRQMTIFYGGQAHVFDDVHPNKADIIMALAGSNGGSWSTACLPGPTTRPQQGESNINSGESEPMNKALQQKLLARLCIPGAAIQEVGSSGRVSTPTGGQRSNNVLAKETTDSVRFGEAGYEDQGKV